MNGLKIGYPFEESGVGRNMVFFFFFITLQARVE